jgi:peptide/nickel transport system substrate-binding protein
MEMKDWSLPTDAAPMTRRSLLKVAAGAGIAAGALPGLLDAHSVLAAATPRRGGTIVSGHVGSGVAEVLDPAKQLSPIDSARGLNLFEGLTWPNPDGTIQYRLAESMTPNKHATRWQIKLRRGVTFHNGKPLTADDVLYTFRRNIKKNLVGGAILNQVDLPACRKVNPHELEVALVRGIAEFPRYVSTHLLMITQAGEEKFMPPIGTGPFMFVSWTVGQRSLFKRNPNYWQSGRPYVDSLEMLSIPDNTARQNALLSGQINCMEFLDYSQAKALAHNPALQLVLAKYGTYIPIYMRVDSPPFSDNRVRTALKLAIKRHQEVNVAALGYSVVSNDLFGQGTPSYDTALPQRSYDPEKAKSLLKQAGHQGLAVSLIASTEAPGMIESATAYAQQAKAAGITINLHQVPASDLFNTSLYYLKVPFSQTQWTHMTWEENVLQSLLSDAPYNETHWKNPQFDKLFYQAQATLNAHLRNEMFHSLQKMIWSDGGYIIWGNPTTIDAASPKLKGIVPSPYYNLGRYNFKDYWIA